MSETHKLVIERELPYPVANVWRALTEGALIKEWLLDNDFSPMVGHRFQFRSTPVPNWNGLIDSEVLTVEPQRKLAYRWSSMGLDTVVTWTLAPSASGTLLRMEHSGFASDKDQAYKGATYGWRQFITNMEKVLANLN